MTMVLRGGTTFVAAALGVASAFAQLGSDNPMDRQKGILDTRVERSTLVSKLRLTEAQRSAIANAVRKEGKTVTSPPSFDLAVGAQVPPVTALYVLPDSALAEVPAAKTVKYTEVRGQIVLVDPTRMRVVDIIKM